VWGTAGWPARARTPFTGSATSATYRILWEETTGTHRVVTAETTRTTTTVRPRPDRPNRHSTCVTHAAKPRPRVPTRPPHHRDCIPDPTRPPRTREFLNGCAHTPAAKQGRVGHPLRNSRHPPPRQVCPWLAPIRPAAKQGTGGSSQGQTGHHTRGVRTATTRTQRTQRHQCLDTSTEDPLPHPSPNERGVGAALGSVVAAQIVRRGMRTGDVSPDGMAAVSE